MNYEIYYYYFFDKKERKERSITKFFIAIENEKKNEWIFFPSRALGKKSLRKKEKKSLTKSTTPQ